MNINPGVIYFIHRFAEGYHKDDIILVPGRNDTSVINYSGFTIYALLQKNLVFTAYLH